MILYVEIKHKPQNCGVNLFNSMRLQANFFFNLTFVKYATKHI